MTSAITTVTTTTNQVPMWADQLLVQARLAHICACLTAPTDSTTTLLTYPKADPATLPSAPTDFVVAPRGLSADAQLAYWCNALVARAKRGVLVVCADQSAEAQAADAIIESTRKPGEPTPAAMPAACLMVEGLFRQVGWQVARVPVLTVRERLVSGLCLVNDPCDPAQRWLARSAALPADDSNPARREPISRWAVLACSDPNLIERLTHATCLRSARDYDYDRAQPLPDDPTERVSALVGEALAELVRQSEARRVAARGWEGRCVVLRSLVESVESSRWWRLLAPLRWLRRMFAGRNADAKHFLAWQHLQAGEKPGDWQATGDDPQWLLPCVLPAGWLRLRLHLTGPANARSTLYADFGEGFTAGEALARFHWSLSLRDELYIHLPKPVRALRFDPLDAAEPFHLHWFSVRSLSGIESLARAVLLKWRLLRQHRCTTATLWRGLRLVMQGQFGKAKAKLFQALPDSRRLTPAQADTLAAYQVWQRRRALTDEVRQRHARDIAAWPDRPTVTLIMLPSTALNPSVGTSTGLMRLVESLQQQTYPHWQLLTPADAPGMPTDVLGTPDAGYSMAAAVNALLPQVRGEWLAFVEADATLAPQALYEVVRAAQRDPRGTIIYTDEDRPLGDDPNADRLPFFKPDWSPDFFLSSHYIGQLTAYRTELVRAVGGLRAQAEPVALPDLTLRILGQLHGTGERVAHVADVLYHAPPRPRPLVPGPAVDAHGAARLRACVSEYLHSIGRAARVEPGPELGLCRVRYALRGRPRVSVLIPSACRRAIIHGQRTSFIVHCVQSIRQRTTYDNVEIVVVDNDDVPADIADQLHRLKVVRVAYTEPFNLSRKFNLGASQASGEYLLLLNDDMEIVSPDWIESMLEFAQWPEVGAVGARLLYPDGRLQHAGVTLFAGIPMHHFHGFPGCEPGYWYSNLVERNYSAVTGACLLTRRQTWEQVGGFNQQLGFNFNDVDYCLKLRQLGLRVVYQPAAQIVHFESASGTGCTQEELDNFLRKWGTLGQIDPFYSPHLSTAHTDYRPALAG